MDAQAKDGQDAFSEPSAGAATVRRRSGSPPAPGSRRPTRTAPATCRRPCAAAAQHHPARPGQARRAWCGVAKVMPQAPAASCRWNSCGAMAVLPWGQREAPVRRRNSAIQASLWSSADRFRTATGKSVSPAVTRRPSSPTAPRRVGGRFWGKPLVRPSRTESRMGACGSMATPCGTCLAAVTYPNRDPRRGPASGRVPISLRWPSPETGLPYGLLAPPSPGSTPCRIRRRR